MSAHKTIRLAVAVTVPNGTDPHDVADAILHLLSTDPDNQCPMIETVDEVEVAS